MLHTGYMAITSWPIFEEITKFVSLLIKLAYEIGELVNIKHALFYIILFSIFSKIILLPLEVFSLKNKKESQWVNVETLNNNKRYSKSAVVSYKPKILLEKFIIEKKYAYNSSSGIVMLFVQLPLLIIMYSVLGDLTQYVPALSELSDAEITTLYTLWGCDIRQAPILSGFKITRLVIFPLIAVIVPTIIGIINTKRAGGKITATVFTSNILTLIFALRFATYLSVYWTVQAIFSFIVSLIFDVLTKNKNKEYYINQSLQKLNKSRLKRKLEPLSEPILIPQKEVAATSTAGAE